MAKLEQSRWQAYSPFVFFFQAEDGERDEGAAGVVDGDKGSIGDDVERLLAAIVRVGPPADVGEKARHMAQAPLLRALVEPGGRHEAVGPRDQFLAVSG